MNCWRISSKIMYELSCSRRESHPLCRLKNPTVISIWLLVGFHPATRSVQSTPADNTRKRVWQYIKKEKKDKVGGALELLKLNQNTSSCRSDRHLRVKIIIQGTTPSYFVTCRLYLGILHLLRIILSLRCSFYFSVTYCRLAIKNNVLDS